MKYNIGDKVVITGHAEGEEATGHGFEVGQLCEIVRLPKYEGGVYELKGEFRQTGYTIEQDLRLSEFAPATTDRIPASDGHEGETFYRFNHTDLNSI